MNAAGQGGRIDLRQRAQVAVEQRVQDGLVRRRRSISHCHQGKVSCDGQRLLNFAGNDYLGLAHDPAIVSAMQIASQNCGVGAGASHMVCGHHREHELLERAVADWLGYPRALLFGSGYLANLAVPQALLQAGDVCLQDKLDHASLIDGARLSQASLVRYPHADARAARRQAQAHAGGALLLATDGVFSMDGDVAPLRELANLANEQQGLLYVDEAHAIGVLGPDGRGSVAAAGLTPAQAPLLLVTLGKALGACGAVLVGQDWAIEQVMQTARSYIYTTAPPPAVAVAALAAVKMARNEPWRRAKLEGLVARFRQGARERGLRLLDSHTPIQPLPVGDNALAVHVAQELEARGFLVGAIRPPSVPPGGARLRITLSAAHTDHDVDALLDALEPLAARIAQRRDGDAAAGAVPC
ncbi:MAG: 8-amino-7-oxononanoate synthase [Proteobacteria bacterium]|nr:8-amino-7-oxononanoate synthase [Pseudomonadota bacterium]